MSETIGPAFILISLLVNLVAAPYYYRKLHRLTEALELHDPQEYDLLKRPSLKKLGMNMSPTSSLSLVGYVWNKKYANADHSNIILAGEKAYKGLIISSFFMGLMFLGFLLMVLSSASV